MENIYFENVSFYYEKNHYIFKNLNFSLPSTGFFIFLGKSGSGKSTFLSLLSNKLQPVEGKIKGIENSIGIVFQSSLLLNYLSVFDNVALPLYLKGKEKEEIKKEVKEVLELVHLNDFIDKDVTKLSGGEKMRVSLARALIASPQSILLDEPTGQLDEKNAVEIYSLLKELSLNHLIILVTHDEKNATIYGDYIYRLIDGNFILEKNDENKNSNVSNNENEFANFSDIKMKESFYLSKKYLDKHKIRIIISTIFLAFSLSILYLGLNLSNNINDKMSELLSYYYNNDVASLSLKEEVADAGKMKLTKYQCPDSDTIKRFGITKSYPCLDYFLPKYNEITIKKNALDIRFEPVIQENKNKLDSGIGFQNRFDVVVNSIFLESFSLNNKDTLNRTINIEYETLVYTNAFKESDMVKLNFEFEIKGISKEKSVFNEPIIYYNYLGIYDYLNEINLKNISQSQFKPLSIIDLLEDEKYVDNDITSQKRMIVNKDLSSFKYELEEKYKNKFKLDSKALVVKENITNIVDSLIKIGLIFLFLILLSAFMLEFISIYSLYDENIRFFALVKTFSNTKENIIKLAISTGLYFFLFTLFYMLLFQTISTFFINKILVIYHFPKFLKIIDIKALISVLFLTLAISIPSSLLPLIKIKDKRIKNELEGED